MKPAVDEDRLLAVLRGCLPGNHGTVGLHEPCFMGKEWDYVKDCLDTGWVSSVGKYVDRFEQQLADYLGVKRAVAVVNGTAALHICLLLAGVEPGDEVLMPALTFVATANAVSYCGATPHFVDSEMGTLGLDPHKLADYLSEIAYLKDGCCINKGTDRRITAVVPMHTFGHPVDLEPLAELCRRFKLVLVEDAAESLGSYYKGRHTGNWGKVSALSFNGNKVITTGGGGALVTNDEELGKLAKHLTTTAKKPHKWMFMHDRVAFNYRMPNINAALGCAQLEMLPGFLQRKRALARRYQEALAAVEGVTFFVEPEFSQSNYWLNAILLDNGKAADRDQILQMTNDAGIMTRPAWTLMPDLPIYKNCPCMDLTTARVIERTLINIPSSASLISG